MSERDQVRAWYMTTEAKLPDVDITQRGVEIFAAWKDGRVDVFQVNTAGCAIIPSENPDSLSLFKANKIVATFGDSFITTMREAFKNDSRMTSISTNADADRKAALVLLSELQALNISIDGSGDIWWWALGADVSTAVKIT